MFKSEYVDEIVKVPLPKISSEHQVMWRYGRRGQYLVKSRYQVALRLKHPDFPSYLGNSSTLWQAIWKLVLPAKVKIFLWKAAQDLLPIAEKLWKKQVIQEPRCQSYRDSMESISHAILKCKITRKV